MVGFDTQKIECCNYKFHLIGTILMVLYLIPLNSQNDFYIDLKQTIFLTFLTSQNVIALVFNHEILGWACCSVLTIIGIINDN